MWLGLFNFQCHSRPHENGESGNPVFDNHYKIMDSRFHGNDSPDLVIPVKAGIHSFAIGQIESVKTLLKLA